MCCHVVVGGGIDGVDDVIFFGVLALMVLVMLVILYDVVVCVDVNGWW